MIRKANNTYLLKKLAAKAEEDLMKTSKQQIGISPKLHHRALL
jgi:hypothetical protein